jgi:hypothetical protein
MRTKMVMGGLTVMLVACGGKAVIDSGADNGSGGATSSNASSGSGSTSGSSGNGSSSSSGVPPRCDSINDCCDRLCDAAATLPCWDDDTECECDSPTVPFCRDALRALYQCMVSGLPESLACGEGEVQISCGACEAEIAAVPPDCGIDLANCAP